MFKKTNGQLTLGEHLIYQNLPEDILSRINKLIDWKPFEKILASIHSAKVGRKAYDPVLMFKILIIQQIYGHSDPEIELMLKGNLFYRRFLGLSAIDPVPDHSTISRFRSDLKAMNLYRKCFSELKHQIGQKGFEIRSGKIIDARLVKAARRPGKDQDAAFTKRRNKTVYGYKDHIAVDPKSEFVSEFVCTPANVHDSQVVDRLLEGQERAIFADKAYDRDELKRRCRKEGKFYGILAKARRNRPLSSRQKKRNGIFSRIRSKVERVFGIFSLHLSRSKAKYVGLEANEIHLFLTCFTYNILNLYWHYRRATAF
jgi:IS5 family transposase